MLVQYKMDFLSVKPTVVGKNLPNVRDIQEQLSSPGIWLEWGRDVTQNYPLAPYQPWDYMFWLNSDFTHH